MTDRDIRALKILLILVLFLLEANILLTLQCNRPDGGGESPSSQSVPAASLPGDSTCTGKVLASMNVSGIGKLDGCCRTNGTACPAESDARVHHPAEN